MGKFRREWSWRSASQIWLLSLRSKSKFQRLSLKSKSEFQRLSLKSKSKSASQRSDLKSMSDSKSRQKSWLKLRSMSNSTLRLRLRVKLLGNVLECRPRGRGQWASVILRKSTGLESYLRAVGFFEVLLGWTVLEKVFWYVFA